MTKQQRTARNQADDLYTATTTADKSCSRLFVSSLFLPLVSVAMAAVP